MTLRELRRRLATPEVQRGIASADMVLMQAGDLAPALVWGTAPSNALAVASVFVVQVPDTDAAFEVLRDALNQIKVSHPDARREEVSCAA